MNNVGRVVKVSWCETGCCAQLLIQGPDHTRPITPRELTGAVQLLEKIDREAMTFDPKRPICVPNPVRNGQ